MQEMGIHLTNKQLAELYFVLDRDGDGEIDTKELLRALTDTRRATQISWIRFEEAESIILHELSLHGGGGGGGENLTSRSAGTDRTVSTEQSPNSVLLLFASSCSFVCCCC